MSEGEWVKAEHGDIRKGDTVRVTTKIGIRTTIIEGVVIRCEGVLSDRREPYWTIEDEENFFAYEFVPDAEEDAVYSTLEKFIPAFVWPTKLGAVVTGKDEDGVHVKAVLVQEGTQSLWWEPQYGTTTISDLSELENLAVVSEGVTVEP